MMATGEIEGFGDTKAWDMPTVRAYAGWQMNLLCLDR